MSPPKTPTNGTKNNARATSSKNSKNASKPRCDQFDPLSGWAKGDEAEDDIFYLAIDSWSRRNAKIKPDAPKGVPSSKVWEPFLCTPVDQCAGIPDYEAFSKISLRLHTSIETEQEECNDVDRTTIKSDQPKSKKSEANNDDDKDASQKTDKGSINQRLPQDNGDVDASIPLTIPTKSDEQLRTNDGNYGSISRLEKGDPSYENSRNHGDTGGVGDDADAPDRTSRINSSRSAPVSRTQIRESIQRRTGSAKSRMADDKLRRAAIRNANIRSPIRRGNAQKKMAMSANPVKISYSHSNSGRSGIFAGNLPMNGTAYIDKADEAPVDTSNGSPGNCGPLESGPDENAPSGNEPSGRTSAERRMLIQEALLDSKRVDYMSKTSHVSIGDLLTSSPRLERRLGNQSSSNPDGVRTHAGNGVYAPVLLNGEEITSSTESLRGRWPARSPRQHNRDNSASPSNESCLPPVPSALRNGGCDRTSPGLSHQDGLRNGGQEGHRSGGSGRPTVTLSSARIPVINYSTKVARKNQNDIGDEGEDDDGCGSHEKMHVQEDSRYIKYNESIMNAIQETTMELDQDVTNRLLKTALARERSRVHSADYVRQGQLSIKGHNTTATQQQQQESVEKNGGNTKSSDVANKRGPPGFRPHNFKTPLQRAVENAHKKIYGQHYYLFNNNINSGTMDGDDPRSSAENVPGLRTQSAASSEIKSAFVWKENIESQIKHKRKPYSSLEKNRLKSKSSVNVSDFNPNFKADVLKTDRRQTTKR